MNRKEAINEAQSNLNILSSYFKFGIPTITETTQSGNVSVISICSDKPQGSGIYRNPILKALHLEEETITFINQQLAYINLLPEEYKKIINYRFLENISINRMSTYVEFQYYAKNKLYAMLDEGLEMIAVYDKSIDYTINDFTKSHNKIKKKQE